MAVVVVHFDVVWSSHVVLNWVAQVLHLVPWRSFVFILVSFLLCVTQRPFFASPDEVSPGHTDVWEY